MLPVTKFSLNRLRSHRPRAKAAWSCEMRSIDETTRMGSVLVSRNVCGGWEMIDRNVTWAVLGIVLSLLVSSGCSLKTGIISGTAEIFVTPANVCPGETVTVTWRGPGHPGSEECDPMSATRPDFCTNVQISSTPASFSPPLPTGVLPVDGSATAIVESDTTFENIATIAEAPPDTGGDFPHVRTDSATANVLLDADGPIPLRIDAVCNGGTPGWEAVEMEAVRSPCVRVDTLCNRTSSRVRLANEMGRAVTLSPGECRMAMDSLETLTASIEGFVPDPRACGSTSTANPPPPIDLELTMACDTELPGCSR